MPEQAACEPVRLVFATGGSVPSECQPSGAERGAVFLRVPGKKERGRVPPSSPAFSTPWRSKSIELPAVVSWAYMVWLPLRKLNPIWF